MLNYYGGWDFGFMGELLALCVFVVCVVVIIISFCIKGNVILFKYKCWFFMIVY